MTILRLSGSGILEHNGHITQPRVPLHDAFVFEAPLEALEEVARLTESVMCAAVREYFPELDPHVEVNRDQPDCWNKQGRQGAIERWLVDPTYSL